MQDPRPVLLVDEQVAEVRDRDATASGAIRVDAQRRLLRHYATGEEGRRLDIRRSPVTLGFEPLTAPPSP